MYKLIIKCDGNETETQHQSQVEASQRAADYFGRNQKPMYAEVWRGDVMVAWHNFALPNEELWREAE